MAIATLALLMREAVGSSSGGRLRALIAARLSVRLKALHLGLTSALVALGFSAIASADDIPTPRGEAFAYDANPSRTNVANEPKVFGPLEPAWTRTFEEEPHQPLIVGDKILVNVGTTLRALDAQTGDTIWSAPTPTTYHTAPIAAGNGVVVSLADGGIVRAFSIATGEPLWTKTPNERDGRRGYNLAVIDGVVYTVNSTSSSGRAWLTAYKLNTGEVLWDVLDNGPDAHLVKIAFDEDRVYRVDECGSAKANSLEDGSTVWSALVDTGHTCFGEDAVVADGVVYAGDGYAYNAATGEPVTRLQMTPDAVDGDLGFAGDGATTTAFSLAGATLWDDYLGLTYDAVEPLIVGNTVYASQLDWSNDVAPLVGYERATGKVLLETTSPYPDERDYGGIQPGMAAGAGHLYVSRGKMVAAMRPILQPSPGGFDLTGFPSDALTRETSTVSAGLGSDARAPDVPIELSTDPFPYGDAEPYEAVLTDDDGVARLESTINRNTRVLGRWQGETKEAMVYAYPEVQLANPGPYPPTNNKLVATYQGVTKNVLRNRKVALYIAESGDTTWKLHEVRRLKIKNGKGKTTFRVRGGIKFETRAVTCGIGFVKDGFGRPGGVSGNCGAKKIETPALPRAHEEGPAQMSYAGR